MAGPNPFPGENNTGHFWDDNLRELNNPPPSWWMIGFWASIAWVVGYFILYPSWPMPYQPQEGEGFTKGVIGWTQIKEYEEGVQQLQEMRAQYEEKIATMTAEQILADPGMTQYTLASAKVLFGDNCSACHGSGGQGKQGKRITEVLLQCAQITPQKPIVHAELFAPGGYRMRLIDNNHTDAAVADKMSDVVGEQQLR